MSSAPWEAPSELNQESDNQTSLPRVELGANFTVVYGYPSDGDGGVLVLPFCNGVDLQFLGLSRFANAQYPKHLHQERLHCDRMKQLGPWWFPILDDYEDAQLNRPHELAKLERVVTAWPEDGDGRKKGGVWVLVAKNEKEAAAKGFARVYNALSMKERCLVLEHAGAVFYDDPIDCKDLDFQWKYLTCA
ncbi:hypothetical protein F4808DRAFT_472910 [Astrocystis sublimbata]|nr:hypothetical protein F4808DRAFT_472910 [Astrocystis sublimbata]